MTRVTSCCWCCRPAAGIDVHNPFSSASHVCAAARAGVPGAADDYDNGDTDDDTDGDTDDDADDANDDDDADGIWLGT